MLNELDSGVVLLRDGAHVVHMNHAARRGLRRLVTLGTEGARVAVVLIPIGDPIDGSAPLTALVFGRSRLCERISVQWFARAHGLTPAESTVLELLSDGLQPSDIARANAVRACSTSHCAWACNTCVVGFSQGSDGEWSRRPSRRALPPTR